MTSFLRSRANFTWMLLAFGFAVLHLTVRHWTPIFTPPASANKPLWVRTGLCSEMVFHAVVLGAVITSIRNRIPWWRQPSYADEGTLTIDSAEISPQPETRWAEIAVIVVEFALYLLLWAWVYRVI